MIRVPYFKQDTNYSCGPATLQMVFAFHGNRMSEESLMRRLHTKKESGTKHGPLIEVATEEGFYVYVNNDSTLDEIAWLINLHTPVIVHFIEPSGEEGHYSVVIDVTENAIILNDPWNGAGFSMTHRDFTTRWHSEDGDHPQWLMAVSMQKFPLGRQYTPT